MPLELDSGVVRLAIFGFVHVSGVIGWLLMIAHPNIPFHRSIELTGLMGAKLSRMGDVRLSLKVSPPTAAPHAMGF